MNDPLMQLRDVNIEYCRKVLGETGEPASRKLLKTRNGNYVPTCTAFTDHGKEICLKLGQKSCDNVKGIVEMHSDENYYGMMYVCGASNVNSQAQ